MKRLSQMLALDLRALALFRIAYSLAILQDLLIRWTDLSAHYTDWGLAPRETVLQLNTNQAYISLHMMNGTWPFEAVLFTIAAAACVCMCLGYRTRLATFVCWLHLVSVDNRNPLVLDGGDTYVRVIMFWCNFMPLGARWSIDAFRSRIADSEIEGDHSWLSMGTIAYIFQISCVYFFASLLKTGSEWQKDGTAVYYSLMIEQLSTRFAPFLLARPEWMKFLTHATLYFEGLGWILLWGPAPLRFLGALGISALHGGFGVFMHLGAFVTIGMSSPLGLWPAFVFNRWEKTALYRWFSEKFSNLARLWPLPGYDDPAPRPLPTVVSGILLYLMSAVALWNVNTIPGHATKIPPPYNVMNALRLDQSWNMFAPRPLTEDGWYVIEAEKVNGEKIDLYKDGGPVSWVKPLDIAATYPNARWRKFMMNIWGKDLWQWRLPYGRYLTRKWNDRHSFGEQIKTFKIYFMLKNNLANGYSSPPQQTLIWTHKCLEEAPIPGAPTASPTPSGTPSPGASPTPTGDVTPDAGTTTSGMAPKSEASPSPTPKAGVTG